NNDVACDGINAHQVRFRKVGNQVEIFCNSTTTGGASTGQSFPGSGGTPPTTSGTTGGSTTGCVPNVGNACSAPGGTWGAWSEMDCTDSSSLPNCPGASTPGQSCSGATDSMCKWNKPC